jgi:heterodisulfide reductase subunit A
MIKLREATLPDVDLVVACDWIIVPERIMPPQSTREVSAALKLDLDREGFFQEANVRHRLIGSPRRGIYFVGAGHDEVDAEDLAEELDALKSALAEAKEVQGRDADVSIREAKCVKCLTCYRICPHGSVMVNPQSGRPFIVPEACFECGICVSSCPACAIEQKAYVKEDWLKEPFEDLTAVFACERSGWLALKEAENRDMVQGEDSRVIRVNCAGRLSAETLMMPLIRGAKRVVVAACHKGNCRSLKGNVLAAARADYLLTDLSMPASRISFNPVAANEPAKAAKIVF